MKDYTISPLTPLITDYDKLPWVEESAEIPTEVYNNILTTWKKFDAKCLQCGYIISTATTCIPESDWPERLEGKGLYCKVCGTARRTSLDLDHPLQPTSYKSYNK